MIRAGAMVSEQAALLVGAAILMFPTAPIASAAPPVSAAHAAEIGFPQASGLLDPIATFTAGMDTREGFLTLYLDGESGKIYVEVDRLDQELLYTNILATGLGTRPNRDRGQTNGYQMALVHFEQHGPRVFLVQENTRFEASSGDAGEIQAVRESFPRSVLASMPVVERDGDRFLVDATDFFLSDVWNLRSEIRNAGQGELRVDRDRSAISPEYTRSFPKNTEVRSILTFATDSPHPELALHAPDGRSITVEQHHSFTELPEVPLARRAFDPRTGHRPVVPLPTDRYSVMDFSQPFDGDYQQRFLYRYRLEPKDTAAYARGELVEPIQPIVFYLDPGIPEPYRSAYREGALWWNKAFESAGFLNAFQVRDLPEGADPMDIRYSMIQTVHRTERGNSVGGQVWDPRTGEVIFSIARIDSHRSLYTYNFYAGLLPSFAAQGIEPQMSAEEFAMARRRQHVAHELGHSLGLWHNFIAASQQRSSVMDYPVPLVTLNARGELDISDAYGVGVGPSDSLGIRYAYAWYPNSEAEVAGSAEIIRERLDRGLHYMSDPDGVASGSYPEVTGWMEGGSALEAADRTTAVRRVLLQHFDERAIRPGEPLAWLNQRLVNVYLHHQPSMEAVIKTIGGMRYRYAVRGDGQLPVQVVPPDEQRQALERLLGALSPEELEVPGRILDQIPPIPWGYEALDPWIATPAGSALDPVAMGHSLAQDFFDNLLHRERAARLVSFQLRDPRQLSLEEVIERLVQSTWMAPRSLDAHGGAYLRATERALLDALFTLAADEEATAEVRNRVEAELSQLATYIHSAPGETAADQAQRGRARREIQRYLASGELPPLRTGLVRLRFSSP